jgi:hypothetical protein
VRAVLDLRDLRVEPEARVVGSQEERVCFAADNRAVSAAVEDEVILRTELVEREVLGRDAKDEGACFRGRGAFPVYTLKVSPPTKSKKWLGN